MISSKLPKESVPVKISANIPELKFAFKVNEVGLLIDPSIVLFSRIALGPTLVPLTLNLKISPNCKFLRVIVDQPH